MRAIKRALRSVFIQSQFGSAVNGVDRISSTILVHDDDKTMELTARDDTIKFALL